MTITKTPNGDFPISPEPPELPSSGNGNRISATRLCILINTPVLMVIAWLSLIVVQDRAEMAVLHDQNANLKAGVLKLQDTVTAAGADRYYGSEARRNNARLLKKIEQHTMKFCHDSACLSLVELKTDMSRLKEDVKDLEREYKSLARAMNGSIP